MNLADYLKIRICKNGRRSKAPALTTRECKEIGLRLPLSRGWPERYANMTVPDSTVERNQKSEGVQPPLSKKERKKLRQERKSAESKNPVGFQSVKEGAALRALSKEYASRPIAPKINKKVVEKSDPFISSPQFLQSFEWRQLRMIAIKLHGAKCQCCGATPSTGAVINVDHIKPRKLFPELALDINNLQILCGDCNHGKGNWDMTDWRKESFA